MVRFLHQLIEQVIEQVTGVMVLSLLDLEARIAT